MKLKVRRVIGNTSNVDQTFILFSPALCHAYGLILLNTEASRERAQCLRKVSISFEHCREETPGTFEVLIRHELNKCEYYYFSIGEGISEIWMVCVLFCFCLFVVWFCLYVCGVVFCFVFVFPFKRVCARSSQHSGFAASGTGYNF